MAEDSHQTTPNQESPKGYESLDRDQQFRVMCAAVNDSTGLMESPDFSKLPEGERTRIGVEAYRLLVARESRMMEDQTAPEMRPTMAERTLAEGYRLAKRLGDIDENTLRMGRSFDGPIEGLRSTEEILEATYQQMLVDNPPVR